ncbi:MAG: hypothetical protein EOP48_29885 [Sphingobacteriales bacterium]|nr:MAG: hypothetical protein EOP48_29885 [Sphingobacteriales bacterium]
MLNEIHLQFSPLDKSSLLLFFDQFADVMILTLLGAAVISGIIGDISDAIVILVIVCINAFIGFFQQLQTQNAIDKLKHTVPIEVSVLRDRKVKRVREHEIVIGDVVLLEAGAAIPADLRITEAQNLQIEESALTGESLAVDKTSHTLNAGDLPIADKINLAFKGTFVSNGRGRGVVIATGMDTEIGRIAKMVQQAPGLTPIQLRMANFGKRLTLLIGMVCILER